MSLEIRQSNTLFETVFTIVERLYSFIGHDMFGRVTFLPTLLFNVAMEKVSSRQWYNRIDKHVILGALPWKSLAPQLIEKEHLKGVISMNEDYELFYLVANQEYWKQKNVKFLQLPTPDIFNAPSLRQLISGVEFMEEIASNGDTVYVHCKAGRTRSATLVACYLINKYNFTPEEAENFMEERRPHIFLRDTQRKAIIDYYKHHNKKE